MSALTSRTADHDLYRLLAAFAEWDFIFLCDTDGTPRRRMRTGMAEPPVICDSRTVTADAA